MKDPLTQITSNKLFQLWHEDPRGDSGRPCQSGKHWKLHINHWKFKIPTWVYTFRWKHIQKCSECGKRGANRYSMVDCTNRDGKSMRHSKCEE